MTTDHRWQLARLEAVRRFNALLDREPWLGGAHFDWAVYVVDALTDGLYDSERFMPAAKVAA